MAGPVSKLNPGRDAHVHKSVWLGQAASSGRPLHQLGAQGRYIATRHPSHKLSHVMPHMIFGDVEERE